MPDIYIAKGAKTKKKPKTKKALARENLAALDTSPQNLRFETQEKEEKIVLFLRRHPITNLPWISLAVLMVLAPLLLRFFPILSFLPFRFQLIGVLIWYLLTLAFALEQFLTWFFNVHIATDERIVDIDFFNLIYKEVSDAKIDRIQDVTYKMGGVARTIFNYGDVFVQTAAEIPNFEFLAVPNPAGVARVLQELRTEEEREALEGRVR